MKPQLDIMVTSGIWPRLLGGACTEIMKHHATKHCARGLRIWAWDTDKRGGDGLVPESMHAAPACMDARNRAQELALRTEDLADDGILRELASSLDDVLGPLKSGRPLLALATATSRKTFQRTFDLLGQFKRPIFLVALADFPQDTVSAAGFAERETAGLRILRQSVHANPNLAALVLSRGAFTGDAGTMDETAKQLFMTCVQHILWLILTHDEPERLILQWHEAVEREPAVDWSFGHLQLDCSGRGPGNPIRGHTLLKSGAPPWEWDDAKGTVTVKDHNHLGLRSDAGRYASKAVHVFREAEHSPEVAIPGIETLEHDTYLVQRIDFVFLNHVPCGTNDSSFPSGAPEH